MNPANAAELRAALERHGFRFSKSRGQNFLIDPNIPRRIAECSGADEGSFVLEVGPGAGSLTVELAQLAGRVCAVEVDAAVLPLLTEALEGVTNAEVIQADALKTDLCKLVSERACGLRPMVCANLPYSITSPLLSKFIDSGCFERITVMVQREVALRLAAEPGTADYGAFTIYVNWHCEVERLFDVPPSCFMPQPKVTSSVIRLTPRNAPPCGCADEAFMFRCVRAAFSQRRKTLANALSNGLHIPREAAAAAIERAGFGPAVRGEALSGCDFARLSSFLADSLKKPEKRL